MKTSIGFVFLVVPTLLSSLQAPAAVSGEDDRLPLREFQKVVLKSAETAVATRLVGSHLKDSGVNQYTYPIGRQRGLCPGEKHSDLRTLGDCTGFLVGDNQTLMTAGHCHEFREKGCDDLAWLFSVKSIPDVDFLTVAKDRIYRCKSVLEFKHDGNQDYALIKLDRPVDGATPFQPASVHEAKSMDPLMVIGHPLGTELMVTFGGRVINTSKTHLLANIDLFKNNSGSPVVNLRTGRLEGVATNSQRAVEFDRLDGCRYIPHLESTPPVIVNRVSATEYFNTTLAEDAPSTSGFLNVQNNCSFPVQIISKSRSEDNRWTTTEVVVAGGENSIFHSSAGGFFLHAWNENNSAPVVKGRDFFGFSHAFGQHREYGFLKVDKGSFSICDEKPSRNEL